MGFIFQTIHHGEVDKAGLCSELERFANDQRIGGLYLKEDAELLVMDWIPRMIEQELRPIELKAECKPNKDLTLKYSTFRNKETR